MSHTRNPPAEMTVPESADANLPEPDNAETEEVPSEATNAVLAEAASPDIDDTLLQHQFERIMFGLNPDDPCLQSDLNDLLAQILEKHLFVNPDERIHLQWRFNSLIANGVPDCPAFREELQNIFNSIWPDANANK